MYSKKTLALICSVLLISITPAWAKRGTESGGGGDASEVRVNEIRSDILGWINKDGANGLALPSDLSYGEYVEKMTDILQPQKVVVEFTENDVSVKTAAKTCRGFISTTDSKPHILCNISRFKNTSESEQYKLIHHEYAGLINIENNEGAASDYSISTQITDFLTQQTVLKLAVKEACTPNYYKDLDENVFTPTGNSIESCVGVGAYKITIEVIAGVMRIDNLDFTLEDGSHLTLSKLLGQSSANGKRFKNGAFSANTSLELFFESLQKIKSYRISLNKTSATQQIKVTVSKKSGLYERYDIVVRRYAELLKKMNKQGLLSVIVANEPKYASPGKQDNLKMVEYLDALEIYTADWERPY